MHGLSRDEVNALADSIAECAAHIDAATFELLAYIKAFDDAGGWHRQGALSCAHWLSWRIGMSLGTAREKVRVAHALAEFRLIGEALRTGEISFSKVRAMTRVATAENEEQLLTLARCSTAAQLEKMCRLYRRVTTDADPCDVEDELRRVTHRQMEDGTVAISIRLLPDEANAFMRAIHVSPESGSLADKAVAMAEAALLGDARRPAVEAVVHVSAETLEGHTELGDGISAETSRRLLCDCGVVPMLEDGTGKTLDVGRKRRTIPSALRRALQNRDDGCRFPGCGNKLVDAHHVEHWIDGGATNLDNTMLLCRRHHRCLHEYGFRYEDGEFFAADGTSIPQVPPTESLALGHLLRPRLAALCLTPLTNAPGWDGLRVDYGLCVESLST